MQSPSSAAFVQAQAQATSSQAAVAASALVEPVNSPPLSLLQGLQERAHAGLQATAQIVREQAEIASQAAGERVKTARAGKNLLDEGGEITAQAVVAKKASLDAFDIDRIVARRVELAIVSLDDAVAKLKVAGSRSQNSESNCAEDPSKVAAEHEERVAVLRQITHMLETPASSAQMSAEEFDAFAIVQAKLSCATVMSKASARLESVKQQTLASISSVSTGAADRTASAPDSSAPVAPMPTLLQGLRENATIDFGSVKQAASDRIDTARAGKKLLDEGGDAIAQLVVAKKASLEAAEIYRNVAPRVRAAIFRFDDSATKLRKIQPGQDATAIIPHEDAAKLAEEHELRAKTFRQIADMLKDPISSLRMNLAEWDAHSLVKVREGCGALQCRTSEGFETVKSFAFASCTSEAGNDGQTRRTRTVCA